MSKMKRTTWLMPVLSACYWGSCQTTTGAGGPIWAGGDTRAAICGFCASMMLLVAIEQIREWVK